MYTRNLADCIQGAWPFVYKKKATEDAFSAPSMAFLLSICFLYAFYFASFIMISLLRLTNLVISSELSGRLLIMARS